LPDQGVDLVLTIAKVTTLNVVVELPGPGEVLVSTFNVQRYLNKPEATGRVGSLEGPEKVGGLLEVGADGVDLVYQVFHADNAVLAKVLLDDGVVGERDTLREAAGGRLDLAVSTLVDEFADTLEVGITVGDEGLDDAEHLKSGLG